MISLTKRSCCLEPQGAKLRTTKHAIKALLDVGKSTIAGARVYVSRKIRQREDLYNTLSFAGVLRNDPGTWPRLTIPTCHFNTVAVPPGAGALPARPSSLVDKALLCVCHSQQIVVVQVHLGSTCFLLFLLRSHGAADCKQA